ncbi:MAG: cell division protein FtsW [Bacteroidetes bacterium]|nr:cell division protein FtsW [Bacteroidota bacterium]
MIISKARKNHIDVTTLVVVLTLMVFSVGVVYSASSSWAQERVGESGRLLGNHAAKVLVGFFLLFMTMQIDYRILRKISKILLIAVVALLFVTLGLGVMIKGASRWIQLGAVGLQPSEFARLALIIHLAALMVRKQELVRNLSAGFLPLMFWVVVVAGLVMAQPAFSTGAVLIVVSIVMLYLGGVRVKHLGFTLAGIVPLLLLYMVSAEYRMRRVMGFVESITEGNVRMNHQVWQGILGFANGGIFGLGPGGSKQRDLFLPEPFGDFVFSIIGEEYGLIGTLAVLTLFLIFLFRGLAIARHARDDFGRLLALGITVSITLYAFINAGVTLGVLPTTGLPLPFISYGGSSMIVSCLMVGILLNISAQTDMHPRLAAEAGEVRPLEPVSEPVVGKVY